MCIGIPMQIVESRDGFAICRSQDGLHRINTLLVGEQRAGTWLMTFLGSAREVLTPEAAAQILDALQAVQLAMQGDTDLDHLFRDLIDREPELPEFLRKTFPQ